MTSTLLEERKRFTSRLVEEWVARYPLDAVAYQGGMARGDYTERADIDLVIATSFPEQCEGIPRGSFEWDGVPMGVYFLDFNRVDPKKWKDKQRYVYGFETVPLFDPEDRFAAVIRESALTREEMTRKLVQEIREIGKRGITYKGIKHRNWRGFHWGKTADHWTRKGEWLIAHLQLNLIETKLYNIVYNVNGRPLPSGKNFHYNIRFLPWLPDQFERKMRISTGIMAENDDEFQTKCAWLESVLTDVVERADALRLLPDDLKAYYNEHFFTLDDNTN